MRRRRQPGASIPESAGSPAVTLYHAAGCHLCERARAIVLEARAECRFDLCEIAIDGDAELEARYREWLPVVEIDGEREFVYHVDPQAFRRRLAHKVAARPRACDL